MQVVESPKDGSSSDQRSTLVCSGHFIEDHSDLRKDIDFMFSNDKTILPTLEKLYKRYTSDIEDITKMSSEKLKRSFSNYMDTVERNFAVKIDKKECKKLKALFSIFDSKVSEIERAYGGTGEDEGLQFALTAMSKGKKDNKGNPDTALWDSFYIRNDLKLDFFFFYVILVKIWFGEPIRKSDIDNLQPCKILILRSLIKRKFDEEIDMR